MHRSLFAAASAFFLSVSIAHADPAAIRKSITDNMPGAGIESVTPTPAAGIFQVELNSGDVVMITEDGKYLMSGELFRLEGGFKNLTEEGRAVKRVELISQVKDSDAVVFPAQGKEKGVVYVFTDTSCGYCQKFHSEMPEINAKGITVKYLAWPRYGLKSPDGAKMTNVWCSDDRRAALTRAKSRQDVTVTGKTCDESVIERGITLGQRMGVRGTPAIFDKDGHQLGGYVPADVLARHFDENKKPDPAE